MLNLLAWFAPDALPRAVLYGFNADRSVVDHALGVLASYNMIDLTPTIVAVHRLVQSVIRTAAIAEGSAADYQEVAIELLAGATPGDPADARTWPQWMDFLPHIDALARELPADHRSEPMLYLQYQAATYRILQGDDVTAVAEFTQLLPHVERVHGDKHPSTLSTSNNLATAYLEAGRPRDAIPVLRQLLADDLGVLGKDHPHPQQSRQRLPPRGPHRRGNHRIPTGPRRPARVLGEDHPDTLITRGHLAAAYLKTGRTAYAMSELHHVLADHQRILGADHPSTLAMRTTLANAYLEAGRVTDAIAEYERVLSDLQRVFGDDHRKNLDDPQQSRRRVPTSGPRH